MGRRSALARVWQVRVRGRGALSHARPLAWHGQSLSSGAVEGLTSDRCACNEKAGETALSGVRQDSDNGRMGCG